jgi:hypothetical protein
MAEIFDRVRLTPRQLRTVADRRLADAECLRKTGANARANGAIYLAGFVLECLLKAQLLEEHPWLQGPISSNASSEEQRLWSLCYRSHDLEGILDHLPRLRKRLADRDEHISGGTRILGQVQRLCTAWTVHARYSPHQATMADAEEFLDHIKEVRRWLLR